MSFVSNILAGGCCDFYNPKTLRASMGGVLRLTPMVTEDMSGMLCSTLNRTAVVADCKTFAWLFHTSHRERFTHNIAFPEVDFPHSRLLDEIITERKVSLCGVVAIENIFIFVHINQQLTSIVTRSPIVVLISAARSFKFHVRINCRGTNHSAFLICVCPGR